MGSFFVGIIIAFFSLLRIYFDVLFLLLGRLRTIPLALTWAALPFAWLGWENVKPNANTDEWAKTHRPLISSTLKKPLLKPGDNGYDQMSDPCIYFDLKPPKNYPAECKKPKSKLKGGLIGQYFSGK